MTEDRETPEYRRQTHEYWEREFGEAVRYLRQKRGWSQRELADRVADEGFTLHQTGIAKIERGARPLRVAESAALATVLGMPTLAVFYGVNHENSRAELEEEALAIRRRIDTAGRVVGYAGALYARAEADMVALVAKAEALKFDPAAPQRPGGGAFTDDPAAIVRELIRKAELERDPLSPGMPTMPAYTVPPDASDPLARRSSPPPLDNFGPPD